MTKTHSLRSLFLSAAAALALAACGGGGSGSTAPATTAGGVASGTTGAVSTTTAATIVGIAGLVGSSCAFEYLPEPRVLDIDKAGYVGWINGRVKCMLADGTVQNVAGLPMTAFQFTGNGVTNSSPEDMVTGTSSIDGAPTYTLQTYRHFASAGVVTGKDEALTIAGQDAVGRTINVQQNVAQGYPQGLDDWISPLGGKGGGTVAASRVIDADGQGYKATTFVAAVYTQTPSTSSGCPVGAGVKDLAFISKNQSNQITDFRYCMYVGLTSFYYTQGISSTINTWQWQFGADTGTLPSTLSVDSTNVQPMTLTALRTPIYKLVSTIRFPKKPSPNFAGVEGNSAGSLYTDFPQQATALLFGIPITWNR